MRIFRKAPDPQARGHRLQTSVPHPWERPQTQFPGIVPINTSPPVLR